MPLVLTSLPLMRGLLLILSHGFSLIKSKYYHINYLLYLLETCEDKSLQPPQGCSRRTGQNQYVAGGKARHEHQHCFKMVHQFHAADD